MNITNEHGKDNAILGDKYSWDCCRVTFPMSTEEQDRAANVTTWEHQEPAHISELYRVDVADLNDINWNTTK